MEFSYYPFEEDKIKIGKFNSMNNNSEDQDIDTDEEVSYKPNNYGVSDKEFRINQAIDEMELSVRSFNCLQAAGIKYIHELVSKEENQMLKYKNFGRKSLTELVEKLDSMGLGFGMEIDSIMAEEG